MVVMTPLTLYLALANPVSDCGCFGDAWILTNWQTFGKNVVLLVAAVSVFKWQDLLVRFITPKMEWMISMYTFLFVFALSFYCLENLPILDFRPYRIGANIKAGMEIPEGAKPSVFESRFIWKRRKASGIYIGQLSGQYMDVCRIAYDTEGKGYEPPIHDFP